MINKNLKLILINFVLYILVFLGVCLVGISNVFALTYDNNVGYQTDITVLMVSADYTDSPINVPVGSGYALAEVKEVIIQVNNYNFSANTNYQLELYLPEQDLGRANYYSVIGANNESCVTSYDNSSFEGSYPRWAFQCSSPTNNITISIKNSSNLYLWDYGSNGAPVFTWSYSYLRTSSTSLSENGLASDAIINNQNQNTQDIIDNQNANNDALIQNDNANTDRIIDENKKNFQSCRNSINLVNISDFTLIKSTNRSKSININSLQAGTYTLSANISFKNNNYPLRLDLYNRVSNSYTLVNSYQINSNTFTFTASGDFNNLNIYIVNGDNNNAEISLEDIQLQEGSVATEYEPYGEEICVNRLDEQTNAINDLNDSLNNSNVDDNGIATAFEEFDEYLGSNSTITQLITLPITLYTAILNNLNGSCSPFNLGELYGEELILPCIDVSQYLGSALWSMIDIIISGFAIFSISKKMIKVFNNFSSLREGDVIND